jgi:hypothetical protein
MSGDRLGALLDHLKSSLDRERDLLIAGDYDTLATEANQRADVMERLAALPEGALAPFEPTLRGVRDAAQRNERLIAAAMEGAAAGKRRVLEVLQARDSLASYDAKGAPVARGSGIAAGRRA